MRNIAIKVGAIALILGTALSAGATGASAMSPLAASTPTPPPVDIGGTNDWCNVQSGLCLRDPSDGGAGTVVESSTRGSSEAEDWKLILDTGRCPNGTVTSSCPGGWVSSHFNGFPLVVIKNVGQGSLCIRTAAGTQFVGVMGTCDSGQEISSAFVWAQFGSGGPFGFDSVDASNSFNTQEWLTGSTIDNSEVFDNPGNATTLSEWLETSS